MPNTRAPWTARTPIPGPDAGVHTVEAGEEEDRGQVAERHGDGAFANK